MRSVLQAISSGSRLKDLWVNLSHPRGENIEVNGALAKKQLGVVSAKQRQWLIFAQQNTVALPP